jgi:hypothetical protein
MSVIESGHGVWMAQGPTADGRTHLFESFRFAEEKQELLFIFFFDEAAMQPCQLRKCGRQKCALIAEGESEWLECTRWKGTCVGHVRRAQQQMFNNMGELCTEKAGNEGDVSDLILDGLYSNRFRRLDGLTRA